MFIEYLEQKTMRTNIKNIFLPVFPRIMGKTVKKTTPSTVGPYKHNQDQPIKNISNKIFCSSLCVLSVGKAFFLPRLPSKNSALAKVAGNGERRQATPPMKSSFTDDRKQRMWMFFSLEN